MRDNPIEVRPTRVRLEASVTVTYWANSEDYGTEDPDEMAAVDQENLEHDPSEFFSCFMDTTNGDPLPVFKVRRKMEE